jgi:subtilisin family serine protease
VANFGSASSPLPYATLNVPLGATFAIDLQWDQPYASFGGGGGATNSLAMALYTSTGKLIGTAGDMGLGQDPNQILEFTNTTGATGMKLVVVSNTFATPSMFKFIVYGNATITTPGFGQGSGTVIGHEMVTTANTVGAMAYSSTPAFGGNDTIENFSSIGPGESLYNSSGNALASPVDPGKVNFVGPDGSITSVFAPFYGTSAAAPNAAAVAALMLQANPDLTPLQVTNMMEASATTALGPAGGTGAGLIQADGAVGLAAAALGHQ